MVDVVQSPQKERESNSNMQWKMTDQGQEGDGKIERSYQIINKCYVTKEKERVQLKYAVEMRDQGQEVDGKKSWEQPR